ncbi:3-phenylpropionate/cinnamic acid dioxygenase subunit beta [Candidatus Entotheonella palauensis]|nr:3-phenylpropionate/cinnamic acid dioxygenase subunit beta [Candidatus Entotheonella palauensis]
MNHELRLDVEAFLYREARLLDDRKFRDWLDLLTEDVRYWMPTRHNRMREGPDEQWEVEKELDVLGFFDETKSSLALRVERFYSGMAWAEDPPSRTRHFISNVEVITTERANEVRVYSNFLAYRSRLEGLEGEEDFFAGRREDILRREHGEWKIAQRRIIFDGLVLNAQNLSIFF